MDEQESDRESTARGEFPAELTPLARYRITLDTPDGVETRDVDAIQYTEGFPRGAMLVTFFDHHRPVASFNAKIVREIRLVEEGNSDPTT